MHRASSLTLLVVLALVAVGNCEKFITMEAAGSFVGGVRFDWNVWLTDKSTGTPAQVGVQFQTDNAVSTNFACSTYDQVGKILYWTTGASGRMIHRMDVTNGDILPPLYIQENLAVLALEFAADDNALYVLVLSHNYEDYYTNAFDLWRVSNTSVFTRITAGSLGSSVGWNTFLRKNEGTTTIYIVQQFSDNSVTIIALDTTPTYTYGVTVTPISVALPVFNNFFVDYDTTNSTFIAAATNTSSSTTTMYFMTINATSGAVATVATQALSSFYTMGSGGVQLSYSYDASAQRLWFIGAAPTTHWIGKYRYSTNNFMYMVNVTQRVCRFGHLFEGKWI
jgi:hypothetical protein